MIVEGSAEECHCQADVSIVAGDSNDSRLLYRRHSRYTVLQMSGTITDLRRSLQLVSVSPSADLQQPLSR